MSGAAAGLFVGTTLMPHYVFERGPADVLDEVADEGAVNAVFVYANHYQLYQYRLKPMASESTGEPYPELWVRTDPARFASTPLGPVIQPDRRFADRDVVDELVEAGSSRGIDVYARVLEPYRITDLIANMASVGEIDVDARPGENVCFNHPDYRAFNRAQVEDLFELHPRLAGFKYGQERGGPIGAVLGGGAATCFCDHCVAKARESGVDAERARDGFRALARLVAEMRAITAESGAGADADAHASRGSRFADPPFVGMLSILHRCPEILQWDRLWFEARESHRRDIYRWIKNVCPKARVGWHIDHSLGWDFFMRAATDFCAMAPYTDFAALAVYFDCMGPRMFGHFTRTTERTAFAGLPRDTAYEAYLGLLGHESATEPALADHVAGSASFSAAYVERETRRTVHLARGAYPVYARIGFDVPMHPMGTTGEQVCEAVGAALGAGAAGIMIAREWHEAKSENRRAAGSAIRDWAARNA